MSGTNAHLRARGIEIVMSMPCCTQRDLVALLRRKFGASPGEARDTVVSLLGDRLIKATADGRLVVSDCSATAPTAVLHDEPQDPREPSENAKATASDLRRARA